MNKTNKVLFWIGLASLIGCVLILVVSELAVYQIKAEVERKIYSDISNESSERALTGSAFLGFSKDYQERIIRICKQYGAPIDLVAAILAHENGHTGFWAAIWRIPLEIKLSYWDPRDWQIAALCQMIDKVAFRFLYRPENFGPYLYEVAVLYNPGNLACWATDVTELQTGFLSKGALPERKERISRSRKQHHGGRR